MMALRHDAFISYSHAADTPLAAALERDLEKLAKPLLRLHALDVFRDQTSLTASPSLWSGIVAHLSVSEWFLFLASPASAVSVWCSKEVQWWLENRSPDRMLMVLTEGDIAWNPGAQDFDWSCTSALPRLLERRIQIRLIEAAETVLIHDDIFGVRFQLRDNIGIPSVADQNAAFSTIRRLDCHPDLKAQVPNAIRRTLRAKVREIGTKAHLKVNHFYAFSAGRGQHFCGRCNRFLDHRNVDAGSV